MNCKPLTLHKKNYLPAQWEFLTNKKKARISAYIGGMGSGKSTSLLARVFCCMIQKVNKDGKSNGLVFYPT